MAFCGNCGNKLSETTKFCGECGAKVENKANIPESDQTKKKPITRKVKISKPKADERTTSVSTTDNEYLKEFFTQPNTSFNPSDDPIVFGPDQARAFFVTSVVCFLIAILILPLEGSDHYGDECERWLEEERLWYGEDAGECGLEAMFWDAWSQWWWLISFLLFAGGVGIYMGIQALFTDPEKAREWKEREEKRRAGGDELAWKEMSPVPLFKRLEEAQELVAKSSYENLGIEKENTTRPPAYCYGPHLEIIGDIFGARTDQTGIGKGADYHKLCEKTGLEGLYTREYDMMVVQFTKNQIMVYKCIFDVLEMTKRLEESYEWNYKHVVGINITGDEKEKHLGGGIAVTGTKYLVISAASGDKIEIVLGAGTRQMVDGKQKITVLGGEEKIYKVANTAMKNIREAVREGAN